MRFLKDNFQDISKLYINQIGVTIFSLFLYTAIAMVDDESIFSLLKIATSVLATLFYLVLSYFIIWEIGAKDKIRIDSGRLSPSPAKGLFISLFANIPNLLLALLAVIFAVLMILGNDWALSAFGTVLLILRFHSMMFMGIVMGDNPAGGGDITYVDMNDCLVESLLYLLLPLLLVAFAHFAYWMGSNEYKIFGFLSSNKKTK